MQDGRYKLSMDPGSIERVSPDTFNQFQNVMSALLKESQARNVSIKTIDEAKDLQEKTLMIDHVVTP